MPFISSSIRIEAPSDVVWDTLKDLTGMRAYMPGIAEVEYVGTIREAEGATRRCRFDDGTELVERVIDWRPQSGYTLETLSFKGVPMKSNRVTLEIEDTGRDTTVTQAMDFQMRGGPIAPLLALGAKGMMRKALGGALGGLKAHVEGRR